MPRPDRDRNPRMRRREPLQEPGQRVRPNPRRSPDPEPPSRCPPYLLQAPLAFFETPHYPLRIRQKLPASLRDPHPTTRPHKQRVPKLLLQRLQTRRQGRLRKIHLLCGPAQIPQPRHRQKAFQLSEEHARSSFQSLGIRLQASGFRSCQRHSESNNEPHQVARHPPPTRSIPIHSPSLLMPETLDISKTYICDTCKRL